MKTSLKTLIVVLVVLLAFAVLTACDMGTQPTTTQAPACEHTGGTATCDSLAVCEKCGESYGETLAHTTVTRSGKPATCTEPGLTDGSFCSVCGEVFTAQEVIQPLQHTDGDDKNHTCDREGCDEVLSKCEAADGSHNCAVCGEKLSECEAAEGSHNCEICDAVLSECKAGANSHNCAVCGKEWSECKAAEGSHNCEICGKEWSECKAAEGSHNCEICGKKWSEHKYDNTCDTSCNICAEEREITHTEEIIAGKDATCTEAGLTEGKKCSVCGDILLSQTRIPSPGHSEVIDAGKPATCTENGLTEGKHCSVCNDIIVAQKEIIAQGHVDKNADFECDVCYNDLCTDHIPGEAVEDNRVDSTCTKAGSYELVVKCSRCGEEISRETKALELASHTEKVLAAVDPDCVNSGLTEGKECAVCGTTIVAQKVLGAYGHADTVVPGKAATCEATGLKDGKKCSVCGETTLEQEVIPAKGHAYGDVVYVWSEDNSTCTAQRVCANDSTHVVGEATIVSTVTLNVTATKVTYTFTAGTQTKTVEADVVLENNIATINAHAIKNRVASHDYVKFGFHDATKTYTFTIYYSEVDVWDGVSVSTSLAGSGTAEDPYLIQSAADLAYVAQTVNALAGGKVGFTKQYMKLTKSIDLNGNELNIGVYIQGGRKGFGGYFDGNNCTIRGINSTKPLFGTVEVGYVKNLSVYGNVDGGSASGNYLGGLSGILYNKATLENVTNYANVYGRAAIGGLTGQMYADTNVKNCVNYGTIVSNLYQVGGIGGDGKANFVNCVNFGSISSETNDYVGGISGSAAKSTATFVDCVNYGTVSGRQIIGGIVGGAGKNLPTDCVNYGPVEATDGNSGDIYGKQVIS